MTHHLSGSHIEHHGRLPTLRGWLDLQLMQRYPFDIRLHLMLHRIDPFASSAPLQNKTVFSLHDRQRLDAKKQLLGILVVYS